MTTANNTAARTTHATANIIQNWAAKNGKAVSIPDVSGESVTVHAAGWEMAFNVRLSERDIVRGLNRAFAAPLTA